MLAQALLLTTQVSTSAPLYGLPEEACTPLPNRRVAALSGASLPFTPVTQGTKEYGSWWTPRLPKALTPAWLKARTPSWLSKVSKLVHELKAHPVLCSAQAQLGRVAHGQVAIYHNCGIAPVVTMCSHEQPGVCISRAPPPCDY